MYGWSFYFLTGVVLSSCAPIGAGSTYGGTDNSPYRYCVAEMKIFNGPVTVPHEVLGTVAENLIVVRLFGTGEAGKARRAATRNVCERWPYADAIMNYHGEVDGNDVYYSGIAIKFVE